MQVKQSVDGTNLRGFFGVKFPYNEYFKIFDSVVTSILTYESEVWGFEKSDSIEQIHSKYAKIFLGSVNISLNNLMPLEE